jgi:hypothetical protein
MNLFISKPHPLFNVKIKKNPLILINKPSKIILKPLRAFNFNIEEASYYIGKEIMLFTFFYTTLNWLTLKEWNDKQQENDDEK